MPIANFTCVRVLTVALAVLAAGCSKETPAPRSAPLTTRADAPPGEVLAKSKGCLVCHGIDKTILGPSYRDVARQYAGDAGAEARLVNKVQAGGRGAWGTTPMPPQTHVTAEEARILVRWVLSLH